MWTKQRDNKKATHIYRFFITKFSDLRLSLANVAFEIRVSQISPVHCSTDCAFILLSYFMRCARDTFIWFEWELRCCCNCCGLLSLTIVVALGMHFFFSSLHFIILLYSPFEIWCGQFSIGGIARLTCHTSNKINKHFFCARFSFGHMRHAKWSIYKLPGQRTGLHAMHIYAHHFSATASRHTMTLGSEHG